MENIQHLNPLFICREFLIMEVLMRATPFNIEAKMAGHSPFQRFGHVI